MHFSALLYNISDQSPGIKNIRSVAISIQRGSAFFWLDFSKAKIIHNHAHEALRCSLGSC